MAAHRRTQAGAETARQFGVRLVNRGGFAVDGTFAYLGDELPAVGQEIDVSTTLLPTNMTPGTVRATVTAVFPEDAEPVRATELN